MEMIVKNHLASKGRIKDGSVYTANKKAQLQTILTEKVKKDGRQRHQYHRHQKGIGIEIHAPPKAKAETFSQSPAMAFKRRIRLIYPYKDQTKDGT